MKWPTLLMALVCAFIAFGGSFHCRSSTGDTDIIVTQP
jgi:hypothetical protein